MLDINKLDKKRLQDILRYHVPKFVLTEPVEDSICEAFVKSRGWFRRIFRHWKIKTEKKLLKSALLYWTTLREPEVFSEDFWWDFVHNVSRPNLSKSGKGILQYYFVSDLFSFFCACDLVQGRVLRDYRKIRW